MSILVNTSTNLMIHLFVIKMSLNSFCYHFLLNLIFSNLILDIFYAVAVYNSIRQCFELILNK